MLNADATSSATPTTGASTTAAAVGTLSWDQTLLAVGIVAVAVLMIGVILIWARSAVSGGGGSVVRSWIALSLVAGLVLFCVFSFAIDDATLRSTLLGGLTASVGAAVTFYFQSKTNQEMVTAATGTEDVPDLLGKNQTDAQAAMANTSLKLQIDTAHTPQDAAAVITDQVPAGNTTVRKGSSVLVRF